jgi:uncharacterized membrane protein YkgB
MNTTITDRKTTIADRKTTIADRNTTTTDRGSFTRVFIRFKGDEDPFASLRLLNVPFARIAIFVIYFWFGILKAIGVSAAGPLVSAMWAKTVPFIPLPTFMVLFSCYEMLIGTLFLIPRMERPAMGLLMLHICTTAMPLVLLPGVVWQAAMVPTMEGQYIIKNIVIVALALSIYTSMHSGAAAKNETAS